MPLLSPLAYSYQKPLVHPEFPDIFAEGSWVLGIGRTKVQAVDPNGEDMDGEGTRGEHPGKGRGFYEVSRMADLWAG